MMVNLVDIHLANKINRADQLAFDVPGHVTSIEEFKRAKPKQHRDAIAIFHVIIFFFYGSSGQWIDRLIWKRLDEIHSCLEACQRYFGGAIGRLETNCISSMHYGTQVGFEGGVSIQLSLTRKFGCIPL